MTGGGSNRDSGLPTISSTNIFAALESRRKKSNKKKPDKEKQQPSALLLSSVSAQRTIPQAWAPTPVSVSSWADCEEDDDEFFAMPALPPLSSLEDEGLHRRGAQNEEEEVEDDEDEGYSSHGEESEGHDEVEEGNEENREPHSCKHNQLHTGVSTVASAREPDRQLSKKEMKKKGLAELEVALAELGLNNNIEKGSVKTAVSKEEDPNAGVIRQVQSAPALAEGKSSKRRKAKKERSFKEGKNEEAEYQHGVAKSEKPALEASEATNTGSVDKTEILKKLTSMKKKKSVKDGDSAAKAAAAEAAVRAAKLAAAKKKEKNHYNQQPGR